MPQPLRVTEHVRVHVFAHDLELRAWLLDELALMSPYGSIEAQPLDSLGGVPASGLLIVGIDRMTGTDLDELRDAVLRHTAVIAIGSPQSLPAPVDFSCVLDTKLTSRQLKRALRELIQRT